MRASVFMTLACLAFSHASTFKDIDDSWSFDLDVGQNADWMATVADSTPISSLSIPGTHNSMTDGMSSSSTQTQNVPLVEQLIGGIRYIDVTCSFVASYIMVYHKGTDTGYSLGDVLGTLYHFLKEHPGETIILRIRNGEHSKDFLETVKSYLGPDSRHGDRVARHVYHRRVKDASVPTLGELRGKVLILQDFKTNPAGLYGLPWGPDTVSNYDHEISAGTHFLGRKWDGIKSHLSKALPPGSNKLLITHTTASTGVHPIDIAARKNHHAGMNKLLGQYLTDNEGGCFGIVVMDFPGKMLVDLIVKLNDKYRDLEPPSLHFDSTDTVATGEDASGP